MEIHFENHETRGSIKIEEGEITVNIDSSTELYREVSSQLEEGVKTLKAFKNYGIPGKIKTVRPYKTQEDILKMLRDLKKRLHISNIVSVTKESQSNTNIIEIDELIMKQLIGTESCIREFGDRYEYCIIKDYEHKYQDFHCDSIQIRDVFVQLLTIQGQRLICSIDFPKKKFDLRSMPHWISFKNIKIIEEYETKIKDAHSVIQGFKFRGTPVVMYRKGHNNVSIIKDHLPEITESFIEEEVRVDTRNSKKVTSIYQKLEIIFNGEPIDYIPEIRLDLTKDLLVSNGHIIVAEYVGDYGGYIGFFEREGYDLPVVWIHDNETKIYIDIHTKGDKKAVIVQCNYSIDIDALL